jgi:hypothetical protein
MLTARFRHAWNLGGLMIVHIYQSVTKGCHTMSIHPSGSGDYLYQAPNGKPAVISEVPSRQAVTGHNVRYVLVFGLSGAMLALGIAYVAMFH